MFICPKCGPKCGVDSFWQDLAPQSRGRCEVCGEFAVCADIHHSHLPKADTPNTNPTS